MKSKTAIILAFVLVFSMVTPIFAASLETGQIVGAGDVPETDIPEELLSGVVPTAGNFDFTIDPFGLLDLTLGDVFDPDASPTNAVAFDTDAKTVLGAHSTSSVPTILTVAMAVTNTDGTTTANGVTVVGTAGEVTGNTNNNVLFWMEPNRTNLKTPANEATANFVGAGEVIAFGTHGAPVTAAFRFAPIPTQLHVVEVSPALELERRPTTVDDRNGTAFSFGGVFNQTATWTDAVNVGIRVVFNLIEAPEGITSIVFAESGGQPVANLIASGDNVLEASAPGFVGPTLVAKPVLIGVTPSETPPDPPAVGFWGSQTGFTITSPTVASVAVADLAAGAVNVPFVGATAANVDVVGWISGGAVLNDTFPLTQNATAIVIPAAVNEIWQGLPNGTADIVYEIWVVFNDSTDPIMASLTVVFPAA